jgi:hypothetical protein
LETITGTTTPNGVELIGIGITNTENKKGVFKYAFPIQELF